MGTVGAAADALEQGDDVLAVVEHPDREDLDASLLRQVRLDQRLIRLPGRQVVAQHDHHPMGV